MYNKVLTWWSYRSRVSCINQEQDIQNKTQHTYRCIPENPLGPTIPGSPFCPTVNYYIQF